MKILILVMALGTLVGCNAQKWGFKNNPDYVLSEAYQAIKTTNITSWLHITTGYPNCKYGSEDALKHLDRELLSPADLNKFNVKLVSQESLKEADYISFWIYHKKSYLSSLIEKGNGRVLADLTITCFYGSSKNDPGLIGKPGESMPMKYCAIEKIDLQSAKDYPENNDCFE